MKEDGYSECTHSVLNVDDKKHYCQVFEGNFPCESFDNLNEECYFMQLDKEKEAYEVLEAENEKLKEALEKIIDTEGGDCDIETENHIFNMSMATERLKYHTFIAKKTLEEAQA